MTSFEFIKSSYSGREPDQECVEVAVNVPGAVAIRDSKDAQGPILTVSPVAWRAFAAEVAAGGFGA